MSARYTSVDARLRPRVLRRNATLAQPVFYPGFPVLTLGGRHVYKTASLRDGESTAQRGQAMTGRTWFYNVNLLAMLQTAGNFSAGTYDFRIVGYRRWQTAISDPATRQVMPGFGNNAANNMLTLRVDNRVVGPPFPTRCTSTPPSRTAALHR